MNDDDQPLEFRENPLWYINLKLSFHLGHGKCRVSVFCSICQDQCPKQGRPKIEYSQVPSTVNHDFLCENRDVKIALTGGHTMLYHVIPQFSETHPKYKLITHPIVTLYIYIYTHICIHTYPHDMPTFVDVTSLLSLPTGPYQVLVQRLFQAVWPGGLPGVLYHAIHGQRWGGFCQGGPAVPWFWRGCGGC